MEVYNQHLEYIGIVDMYIIIPGDPSTSVLDSIVGLCEMTKIDWNMLVLIDFSSHQYLKGRELICSEIIIKNNGRAPTLGSYNSYGSIWTIGRLFFTHITHQLHTHIYIYIYIYIYTCVHIHMCGFVIHGFDLMGVDSRACYLREWVVRNTQVNMEV